MWYALGETKPNYQYSFNHQNWYPSVEQECKNTTENVGLFELTPFSKYEIRGEKAYEELQRLCTANIKNEIGKDPDLAPPDRVMSTVVAFPSEFWRSSTISSLLLIQLPTGSTPNSPKTRWLFTLLE